MIRRPKVQFKPKIQVKGSTGKPTPVAKPRASSTSSVTSTSSVIASEAAVNVPLARTTITEVPPSEHEGYQPRTEIQGEQQEVEEETVIGYENLVPVVIEEYNCLVPSDEIHNLNQSFESSSQDVSTHGFVFIEVPSGVISTSAATTPLTTTTDVPKATTTERRGSRITLKPKETPAALTVSSSSQDSLIERENVLGKKAVTPSSPRKPKICLSSSRVKLPQDKSKVTMFDLLSYNPPMSEEQKERRKKADEEAEASSMRSGITSAVNNNNTKSSTTGSPKKVGPASSVAKSVAASEKTTSSSEKNSTKKSASQGIRVKMGADGNIIVDEESLVLTTNQVDAVGETVYEGKDQAAYGANYASFRSKERGNTPGKKYRWSDEDTVLFYRALSAVGTDFTLMANLFFSGRKNRLDLRNKFKKEEKFNQHLIDKTLINTDLSLLHEVMDKVPNESTATEVTQPETVQETLQESTEEESTEETAKGDEEDNEEQEGPSNNKQSRRKGNKRRITDEQDDTEFRPKKKSNVSSSTPTSSTTPVTRKSSRTVKAPTRLT